MVRLLRSLAEAGRCLASGLDAMPAPALRGGGCYSRKAQGVRGRNRQSGWPILWHAIDRHGTSGHVRKEPGIE